MREKIVTSNVSDQIGEYKKSGRNMIFIFLFSVVVFFIGASSNLIPLTLIGIAAAIGSGVMFVRNSKHGEIYRHGHKGEMLLRQELHRLLADDYIAYFGYPLKDGGDIDCILLGPSGLYVIETKHHNGSTQYSDGGWR